MSWKVAFVGYSQIRVDLECEATEIKGLRAAGGKACDFYDDDRMNEVLQWEYDITMLWLGSNDMHPSNSPVDVYMFLKEFYDDIIE